MATFAPMFGMLRVQRGGHAVKAAVEQVAVEREAWR